MPQLMVSFVKQLMSPCNVPTCVTSYLLGSSSFGNTYALIQNFSYAVFCDVLLLS